MKSIISFLILCFTSSIMVAQCYPDRHNTSSTSAWLSCSESANPNAVRGNSHWIKYDFDYTYELGQVTFWNYNETEYIQNGIQEIVIDYSLDGEEWIEWGTFTLNQSAGSSTYEGDAGPDLDGLFAKHILFTAISNYGGNCYGLSEVKIGVESFISDTDEPLIDVELSLSPIPADQQFTIEIDAEQIMEKLTYAIIDMQGKLISRKTIEVKATSISQPINTLEIPNGQYIVALQSDLFSVSRKISIIHP